jgi:hypothetical protein
MLATRCECGFEALEDEQVIDHLLAVFQPDDALGTDGKIHEEIINKTCSCGFSATTNEELDSHYLAVFTPASSIARDGTKHESRL